jgi:hypothetical protein
MPKAPNVTREDEPTETTQSQPTPQARPPGAQTFGEKAVGLSFNPSGDAAVHELKNLYAQIIDICHAKRGALMQGSEAHRLYAIAITQAQDAQMWSVKAATWRDG